MIMHASKINFPRTDKFSSLTGFYIYITYKAIFTFVQHDLGYIHKAVSSHMRGKKDGRL